MLRYLLFLLFTLTIASSVFAQNKAAFFDGKNSYAQPLNAIMAGQAEGTIELWFKANSWKDNLSIVGGGQGVPGSNNDKYRIGVHPEVTGQEVLFGTYEGNWIWHNSHTVPQLNNWTHVAVSWASESTKIYINGQLKSQSSNARTIPDYNVDLIAVSSWGDYFDGAIDELRMWHKERSQEEIKATMNDTLQQVYYTSSDSSLAAYYRFDKLDSMEINGVLTPIFKDYSINANHAKTKGNTHLAASTALNSHGLVAYYPFNGSASDSSQYANHGTNHGAMLTHDRFGNENSAYEFNGTSSYISVPSSQSLESPTNEITVSAWIYVYNYSLVGHNFGPIIMKSSTAENAFQYRMAVGSSGTSAAFNNWNLSIASDKTVGFNSWHHVAYTLKNDTIYFYQDGTLANKKAFNITIAKDSRPLEIGRDVPGATEVFYGKIDDIRIYNKAISADDIMVQYKENGWGTTPKGTELVAHYSFDGHAQDSTLNKNDGTVHGATLTTDKDGMSERAYQFDGTDDYIDIGNHPTLKMDKALTITSWVKFEAHTTQSDTVQTILTDFTHNNPVGKLLRINGAHLEFKLNAADTAYGSYNVTHLSGSWHHMAVTYDGDSIKIYIDGHIKSAIKKEGDIAVTDAPLFIGKEESGNFFNGGLDNIKIFNGALSATEIAEMLPPNSIGHQISKYPAKMELHQNWPNPFNPSTTIKYTLQSADNVSLKVYDLTGKTVATLVNGKHSAGTYNVSFKGSRLASGIYIYQLKTSQHILSKKMILVK